MEFTAPSSALADAVGRVCAHVKPQHPKTDTTHGWRCRRHIAPVLQGLLVTAEGPHVTVLATDWEVTGAVTFEADVATPGHALVAAARLGPVSRHLPAATVRVAATDWCLKVESGPVRYRLGTMPTADYPLPGAYPDPVDPAVRPEQAWGFERAIMASAAAPPLAKSRRAPRTARLYQPRPLEVGAWVAVSLASLPGGEGCFGLGQLWHVPPAQGSPGWVVVAQPGGNTCVEIRKGRGAALTTLDGETVQSCPEFTQPELIEE